MKSGDFGLLSAFLERSCYESFSDPLRSCVFGRVHGSLYAFTLRRFSNLLYMAALEGTGGCPCTNDKKHFKSQPFSRVGALCGEFELPSTRDGEWLLFSYT